MIISDIENKFKYKEYSNVNWNHYNTYINNDISEDTLHFFRKKIKWIYALTYIKVSENFLNKHIKYCYNCWKTISQHQNLSEEFIEKYKDYVNWNMIAVYQNLSIYFLIKYHNKINTFYLNSNKKISDNVKSQFTIWLKNYNDLLDYCNENNIFLNHNFEMKIPFSYIIINIKEFFNKYFK